MTDQKKRILLVSTVLVALVVSPVPAVILSFEGQHVERMISHVFGVMSLMCMCLSLILSARLWGTDAVFGGLDKAYRVHMWLGLSALVTLLIHDTLEAEVDGLKSTVTLWGWDWHDLGSDMGSWVYNGLVVLLAITFVRLVPYRWWYWTHRLMVLMFALSVAHFVIIPKPLALSGFGGLYILFWSALGLVAAVLALRPASWRGGVPYKVTQIEKSGNAMSLHLLPHTAQRLRHRAGQFVALRGDRPELAEWHPFTLSSAPQSHALRVTFAARSRWTRALADRVAENDIVFLRGPHGRFFPSTKEGRQIWLSGGVGLTPHLAWAQDANVPKGPLDIIHICRDRHLVPHLAELEAFAAAHGTIRLKVFETGKHGRPDARDLLRLMGDRDEAIKVYFCGSDGLRETLDKAVLLARKSRFETEQEAFELRAPFVFPKWFVQVQRHLKAAVSETFRTPD